MTSHIIILYTVVPRLSSPWLSKHSVIQTVSSQIPQSKYLQQQHSFQWFTEILPTASMTTKGKHTVLSIEDKITICEHLSRDLLRVRSLVNTKQLFLSISCIFVWLSKLCDYLNKSWSQWGRIIKGALYFK